jgi:hypothetical protein
MKADIKPAWWTKQMLDNRRKLRERLLGESDIKPDSGVVIEDLRARVEGMREANERMEVQRDEAIRQSQGYLETARNCLDERDILRAENARLQKVLTNVMEWINNWDPNFVQDEEWGATRDEVRAVLFPNA